MRLLPENLIKEFGFRTSRSGGKGGQNVNKVSSKVELYWNVENSDVFTEDEKKLITQKLQKRINKEGFVQIISEEDRSQLRNKETAIKRIYTLLLNGLKIEKPRKATKPNKAAIAKRLDNKKQAALKKINRKISWDYF
jgi:ribosome-associated protein